MKLLKQHLIEASEVLVVIFRNLIALFVFNQEQSCAEYPSFIF